MSAPQPPEGRREQGGVVSCVGVESPSSHSNTSCQFSTPPACDLHLSASHKALIYAARHQFSLFTYRENTFLSIQSIPIAVLMIIDAPVISLTISQLP
ncbi:hypothetical protein BDQ17DRAFT_1433853 [Cyathus striatus]|nr:hypothetical protein BDQ17DRAFT_1433853 [Cyathus striatus]